MTPLERLRSPDSLFNLPNLLTMVRFALIPLVGWLLANDAVQPTLEADVMIRYSPGRIAGLLVIVAGVTDLLDGWFARRWGIVTLIGKFLDPLADKLFLMVGLVMLMKLDRVPAWLVLVLLSREFLITGLRAVAIGEGIVIDAGRFGKLKTAFQLTGLGFLMWYGSIFTLSAYEIGIAILYGALVISLYSGYRYLYDFFKELKEKRGYVARVPKK